MSVLTAVGSVLRRLSRAPAFPAAAIAMLALGIGLTVAMVCTVDGVLLRGLPVPDGERLVAVVADNPAQQVARAQLTVAEAEQLARATAGFEALGYFQWTGVSVLDAGHAREIPAQFVSPGFFAALGVQPLLGRVPTDEDIRAGLPLAVLSHEEWQRAFGGDAGVIGRRLDTIGHAPLEVVGVMPPAIDAITGDAGVWTALLPNELPQDGARRLDLRILQVIGRLQAGTSLAQANAALAAQLATLRAAHGLDDASGWRLHAYSQLDLLVGGARGALWGAFALACMVLLIACANVAILLDARQAARRRELAVMQAIGASRERLRGQLLLELTLLGAIALALGVALAHVGIALLRGLAEGSVPRVDGIVMDWRVFAVAAVLALTAPLCAVLGGSLRLPAAPAEAVRGGGKGVIGGARTQRLLPAAAMALSTASLVAALGVGLGLWRLQRVEPGFRADGVHALTLFRESLGTDSGTGGPPEWTRFSDEVLQRLAALPGADGVALTTVAPLVQIGGASADVRTSGGADDAPVQAAVRRVSPGYRTLLGVPLLAGRDFGADDRVGSEPVAIVNRTLARRLFGEASPLGRTIDLPLARSGRATCRIVGIVEDIRNDGLRAAPAPEVMVPFAQAPRVAMTFLLRSTPGLQGVDAAMAAALWSVDARQSITRQFALDERLAAELRPARFFARVVGAFAFAALLLAVLGVYAVASLQQRRRVGEFGLRLAIGATPARLARTILRDSLLVSAAGIAAGLGLAAAGARLLGPLRAVGDVDLPSALALGLGAMGAAAALAALLPALRAARVPPMEALRDG
ncbi:ABC transporter permease [Dokdonella sp.]|uniref:ABC transporter permease n=1 Tax=Dokdonella sp. TaxID=2291710 RepID=UPI001B203764|nr:ABC transporter permease [Dokdonella sp.]MBO9663911.1 ABC transporter permease [Dokdonella sp.]